MDDTLFVILTSVIVVARFILTSVIVVTIFGVPFQLLTGDAVIAVGFALCVFLMTMLAACVVIVCSVFVMGLALVLGTSGPYTTRPECHEP
jgi:hypothetical protein